MTLRPILLACALALPLASCSTISAIAPGSSLASAAPATMIAAEKALTITHLAFNGVSTGIQTFTASGVLRGPAAAQVKVWYDKAGDALIAADKADAALNAQGIMAAIGTAQDAIAAANAIVYPKR